MFGRCSVSSNTTSTDTPYYLYVLAVLMVVFFFVRSDRLFALRRRR